MSIQINIESVDRTSLIEGSSLNIEQNITSLVDKASFSIRKYGSRTYTPTVGDEVIIYDGSSKIFAGTILNFEEFVEASKGVAYNINCVDWTYDFDRDLVVESYKNMTVKEIIQDIVDNFTSGFTYNNVTSEFEIESIIFNQIHPSDCLKKLAGILNYDWYIDEDKDVHFFSKEENIAPYNLQDDSGNYVYKSLARRVDGSQIANTVLVRGGEFDGDTFTDVITVKGNDSLSFDLPYKFSNLTIELDTGGGYVSQTVGNDFDDDFTSYDVLYNFQEKVIKFETALSDGDLIRFSGNPKTQVLSEAEDSSSIAELGVKKKIINDNTIKDLATARRRATAELSVYANEIEDVKFRTYTTGLRAGMLINLTSTVRGSNTDFIIKKLKATLLDPVTFKYDVELVTTKKYELTELLRSLLEPPAVEIDDNEIAQKIKFDKNTVSVAEDINVISASEDDATVSVAEDIQKDPLGAGVEPFWVLAPHSPSPFPTDTNRVGLLDNSFEVY